MATNNWLGRAKAVAGVKALTVAGTVGIGDAFTVTINGKSITFTATAGTIANVTAGLTALLNASTVAEFSEITWADANPVITATHDTAGTDFTVTTTETAPLATFITTTTTAVTGPNHYNDANNWSLAAVPVATDDVYIDTPVPILYGLDQSAVLLNSLTITARFQDAAYIGLPLTNATGGYTEYRDRYLRTGATTVLIGTGDGQGSSRINLDLGTDQTNVEVRRTSQSAENGVPALSLKLNHASSVVDCRGGTVVGIAVNGGETSTLATLRASPGAVVTGGPGCTATTISGQGNVTHNGPVTTLTQSDGSWTVNGTSTPTTLTQTGGTLNYNSSGTITTATIGGTLDCSADMTARTITNCTLKKNGRIRDPHRTLTYTNGILIESNVEEIQAN